MNRMTRGLVDWLVSLVIPPECLIWLQSRHPMLLALISVAVLLLLTPCVLGCVLGALTVGDYFERGNADMLWAGLGMMVIPVASMALLTWLLRSLLYLFWKPTPQMLAQNDEVVAAEVREVEVLRQQESAEAAERKRRQANTAWFNGGALPEASGGSDAWEHPDRETEIGGRNM